MKVGFARAVITPPVGSSLVGYFEDRRSAGVRDELYSTACVFDAGATVFAVVSCDLVWVPEGIVEPARRLIAQSLRIPPAHVIIHATHTHTGPLPAPPGRSVYENQFSVVTEYIKLLPHYIAGSVRSAWENRREARIGSGITKAGGLAFHRRYHLKDGRVVTNPLSQRDQVVRSAGPADESVGVIKVEDTKGVPLGILVNFAMHPDTLGDNLISSDWPGRLRERVRASVPGAECLLLNGPSGDINHLNLKLLRIRGVEIGERVAQVLTGKIMKLLPEMKMAEVDCLGAARSALRVPFRAVSPEELREAKSYVAGKGSRHSLRRIISQHIIELARVSQRERSIPAEVIGCCLGDRAAIISLPGELFTEIGQAIREQSSFPLTMIAQNSSSVLGYVPSAAAFAQDRKNFTIRPHYGEHDLTEAIGIDCSYETSPLSCRVDESAGVLLEQTAGKLLGALAGKCRHETDD